MIGRHIRIIQEEDVVGVDAILHELLRDALHGVRRAGHMHRYGLPHRQDLPCGAVQSRHVVVHLGRIDRAADPFQDRPHFLGSLVQSVGENLESDRVYCLRL